jgi:hypothetical protein
MPILLERNLELVCSVLDSLKSDHVKGVFLTVGSLGSLDFCSRR